MCRNSEICVTLGAFDHMMPMHLIVGLDAKIKHVGPTLAKTSPDLGFAGKQFFEMFEPRRRSSGGNLIEDCARDGNKVYLRLRDGFQTQLIGTASLLPNDSGILMNLSFGIAVVDAVGNYDLAGSDFAATDLTLEMLYMVEAKSAALTESSLLNQRLHGAKTAAEADAGSDMLTGLCNRRILNQVLNRLVTRNLPFTLMHMDLDFFKAVNDTLGHAAGDHVLQVVAKVLVEETRKEDTVARVGGDEFVLVFDRLTDTKRLEVIANRIIRRLEVPISIKDGSTARISGSIGLVPSTLYDVPDPAVMMENADTALYASKQRGRACFTLYKPGTSAMHDNSVAPTSRTA